MANYYPIKQGTILLPSGTAHNASLKHLYIVCTESCDKGLHLLVTMSSWKNEFCDGTCILTPENCDHQFVKKKSYIMYRKSRLETSATLVAGVEKDLFFPKDMMPDAPFERIISGILASPHTPRKIKNYFKHHQ